MSYEGARDAPSKEFVWILEFPALGKRLVSTLEYTGLASPADPGLAVQETLASELDPKTGVIEFDEVTVVLVGGAQGSWLASVDRTLRGTEVHLKYGFEGVDEADFKTWRLLVESYSRIEDGFSLRLASALTFLDAPLLEGYSQAGLSLERDLDQSSIHVSVLTAGEALDWDDSGYVLVWDQQNNEVELIAFEGITVRSDRATDLEITGRRALEVGHLGRWSWSARSGVARAAAFRANPVDVFLRLATTTDDGSNGPYDAGDGLGLAVPQELFDIPAFEATRDAWIPREAIYCFTEKLDSLLSLFTEEFLAMGLYFSMNANGMLSLRAMTDLADAVDVDISGQVQVGEIIERERGWDEAGNNVVWEYDYNPAASTFHASRAKRDSDSEKFFVKAEAFTVQSRGARGSAGTPFGWPNLGWDEAMRYNAAEYVTEFTDPSLPLPLVGFVSLIDVPIGALVRLTHPGIHDFDTGSLGVSNALFYVVAVERDPEGVTKVTVRQRRLIGRPWYILPNGPDLLYDDATEEERQYGFICPNSLQFPDGSPPYDTGI